MANFVKDMLALGLTIGLSDREAFVTKVAGLIEEYQNDPEKAEKWAGAIVDYLEEMKENLRMQNNISSALGGNLADSDKIDRLTNAIDTLTEQLKKQQEAK